MFRISLLTVAVIGITSLPQAHANTRPPRRIVITSVDQVVCRSVKTNRTTHTVCEVRRIREPQTRGPEIPPPMAPLQPQLPPADKELPQEAETDEDLEIPGSPGPGIPPALTEEQMPEGLKELPAPVQPNEIPDALPEASRPPPLEGNELPDPVPKRPPAPAQPMIVTPPLDGRELPPPPRETPPRATEEPKEEAAISDVELEVIRLLNQERRRRGLRVLKADPAVAAVARAHSQDMCQRHYFSHHSPEGKQPWDRLRSGGVRGFTAAAENIAVGYSTAQAVHLGWLASPGHRRNRLDATYTRVGVGLFTCPGHSMPYWTEVFVR